MKKFQTPMRMIMALAITILPLLHAHAWEWEWTTTWGEAVAKCEECGAEYTFYAESTDEAEEIAAEFFCEDCGSCSEDVNSECYRSHHCQFCSNCIDNGEYHEGVYNKFDEYICYDCFDELASTGEITDVCSYCHELFGEGAVECDCEYSMIEPHCTDCSEVACEKCNICLVIAGEDTEAMTGDACLEHSICNACMEEAAAEDLIHCRVCFMCDEDICDECGLCESCAEGEEHCPECGHCFGDEVQWCVDGGEHCILCCEENEWKCGQCGKCTEGLGLDMCDDCGLCESCCHENSESEGCGHGYCIASADYEDHLCPECQQCPEDEECEYCGLCQDCQADYHCEHELCPDGSDFDDHVCPDCGNCFDEGELCEYCGLCEDCREHCEHDICPEDDDDSDHFICEQCGDCYEGVDRCDVCMLCLDCCADNTSSMGCDHDLCIESDDFAEHWCYEDDQCLELCNHDADCEHLNVSTAWKIDGTAHWLVCQDCGIALNKAIHSEGTPITLTAPNPSTHTNGTAQVNCEVCNHKMGIISIPYYEVPADGKPYILIQPTDYTGKTNTSAYLNVPQRYATFKVKAGGENLTYQWYRKYGDGYRAIEDDTPDEDGFYQHAGAQTATLKAIVATDACDDYAHQYYTYYCVISNEHGNVTSDIVTIKAQHVFGRYYRVDDETHDNLCFGECSASKGISRHRFDAWVLVRPATESETGLLEQKCLDCDAKITEVIPKVEPGHVHEYNVAKHSVTQHWFVCSCGLSDPNGVVEDHVFDQTEVITEPTEKKMGENKVTCSACGYSKTMKTDKLPHTHEWYTFREIEITVNGRFVPDPEKGGYGLDTHHIKCKGCDQIKTEPHTWPMWECTKAPKSEDEPGKMIRYCEVCGYEQIQFYPLGTWPIMIEGGTANKNYAKTGTQIIITFDPKAAKNMTHQDKPVKFKQWYDGTGWTGYTNIPWDNGRTSIDLPRLNFQNPLRSTTQFIMPNGPATVFADTEECTHTGGTKLGERVEPTCGGYGHEPNTLCKDCNEVLEEGTRIPALGHDLPSTPIEGTEEVYYCTVRTNNQLTGFVEANIPNPEHTHGWSGDFLCNRCGEIVKGKRTPLEHGLDYYVSPYETDLNWQEYRNVVEATCTTDGYTGDVYCKFCGKLDERGERYPRLGHEWGEWQTIREATTKIKGMEQRVCERNETHIETRITDYSGPDYRLKPDKTKLRFEWTYGDPIPSQTITFKSIGRNDIHNLTYAIEENDLADVSFEGLTLTITPKDFADDYESALTFDLRSLDENGENIYITMPEMYLSCHVKKTSEKYNLIIEDGLAVLGTTRKPKMRVRGGEEIKLEPEDEWKADFLRWELVDDASGLMARIEDLNNVWTSGQNKGRVMAHMSPNDVTARAIYKKNEPTITFSETEVTASVEMPFMEPILRTTPGKLNVTYSSSDESVATVSATGHITFQGAGITTITASFNGNTHYSPATATYTLTVPQDFIDGVSSPFSASLKSEEKAYNLAGQRVSEKYKGIVITTDKKYLRK